MFNLTRQERQAVLFLLSIAIAGTGINYFSKTNCRIRRLIAFNKNITKVNLNKADKAVLMSLPGVGEKIAERIIVYRKDNGGFKEPDELKDIKGITEQRYEGLKDSIYIE